MKYLTGYTDLFLSPVTGIIPIGSLPSLTLDYIWVGNRNNKAQSTPALIDIRLDLIDLRHQLSDLSPLNASYLLALTDSRLPKSQSLQGLEEDGLLKTTENTLALAIADEDYLTPKPSFLTKVKEDKLENSQSLESLEEDGLLKTVENALQLAKPDEDYVTPDGLEKELEPIKEDIKELQEFQKSAEAQFEEIIAELEAQQAEIDGVLSSIAAVEGEIFGLQAELFGVELTVAGLGISLGIVEGQVSSLQSDVKSLEGDVSDLQDWEGTAKGQISSLQTEVSAQQGQINSLQTRVTTVEGEIVDIHTELHEIETAIGDLELAGMPSHFPWEFTIYTASDLMNASLDAILAADESYLSSQNSLTYANQSLIALEDAQQAAIWAEDSAIRSRVSEQNALNAELSAALSASDAASSLGQVYQSVEVVQQAAIWASDSAVRSGISEQNALTSELSATLSAADAANSLNQVTLFLEDSQQAAIWDSDSAYGANLSKESAFSSELSSALSAADSAQSMNQSKAFALLAEGSANSAQIAYENLINQPIQLIGDVSGYGAIGSPIFTQLNIDLSRNNNPPTIDIALAADIVYGALTDIGGSFDGVASLNPITDFKVKTSYGTGSNNTSLSSLSLLNRQNNGYRLKSGATGTNKPAFSLQSILNGVYVDLFSFNGTEFNVNNLNINGAPTPTQPGHLTNKAYVDSKIKSLETLITTLTTEISERRESSCPI